MRTKNQIFKQLLQIPKPFSSSQKGQVERTEIYLEVLIDIRDQLYQMILIESRIETITFKQT